MTDTKTTTPEQTDDTLTDSERLLLSRYAERWPVGSVPRCYSCGSFKISVIRQLATLGVDYLRQKG